MARLCLALLRAAPAEVVADRSLQLALKQAAAVGDDRQPIGQRVDQGDDHIPTESRRHRPHALQHNQGDIYQKGADSVALPGSIHDCCYRR